MVKNALVPRIWPFPLIGVLLPLIDECGTVKANTLDSFLPLLAFCSCMKQLNCILFVDDDVATVYLHKRLINKLNITEKLVTCRNGLEALEYVRNAEAANYTAPDLIFLDVNMPQMDGFEFLKAYAELDDALRAKHVIMLTSSLMEGDVRKAEGLGVSEYVDKPLTERKMRMLIETYFAD